MAGLAKLHPDHPLPDVDDPIAAPFWDFCRQRELRIQQSRSSGRFVFPPRPQYAGDFDWVRVCGRGRVLTFVIVRPPFLPAFADKVPFVVAVIELDEGPRLVGNIHDCPVEHVRSGMPVEVVFEDITERVTLPQWRPLTVAD
ncbi:MAG: Zn-ribbon domain-containing OB-fold protein [Candidatus Binatia bacterium]